MQINCACGRAIGSVTPIEAECALYKEKRVVPDGEVREVHEGDMFDARDSRKKTMIVLGG